MSYKYILIVIQGLRLESLTRLYILILGGHKKGGNNTALYWLGLFVVVVYNCNLWQCAKNYIVRLIFNFGKIIKYFFVFVVFI